MSDNHPSDAPDERGAADDPAADEVSVCVVTHPLSEASEAAIDGLLEVVAAVASVSLITANLPDDSDVWDEYDVTEISDADTGDSVAVAAVRFLLNQLRMAREIRRRDEEVVLFFGATSYLLPILFARLLGRTVVLEPRGNVPESLYRIWRRTLPRRLAYALSRVVRALERIGYAAADGIVALSPGMADDLELRPYERKLYEHGARPVDTERFRPTVPFDERDRRIGYLGRLDEEKGVDDLVEVVARLPDDVTFVFIGDGSLRPSLEDELAAEIERGTVEVTGWVDHEDVPARLNDLRLLVMLSETEGVPTTALEAMSCGTPVCARPIGGIPDVVRDGDTGYHLADESPEATARRIEELLDDDRRLRRTSEAARAFVAENYSFEAVADRYRKMLEEVRSDRR